MMRKSLFLCVVLLTAGTLAFAQDRGQGGRRGQRGGGPMGMGMGMGMFSGPMGKVFLLANPQVQKELELTEEQKEKLQELRPNFGGGDRENRPSREEMQERMEKLNGQIKEILLPNQVERLNQIRVQLMGPGAFADPEVAKDLGISEEQQKKMNTLRDDFLKDFQKKLMEHISTALSSEQKAKFEKLIGEKFELDMSQMFGPRNRGREGRNRPAPVN